MKILIVEDELALAKAIEKLVVQSGYIADVVHDGIEALYFLEQVEYDAVILDVMMPKMNGYEVLRKLRSQENFVPVIMLTAKSELGDKLKGFKVGADDYLTKPFEPEELLVRIKAVARRKRVYIPDRQTFLDLTIDRDHHTFSVGEESIRVNAKEFLIMEMFIQNKNQIISKERIRENICGYDYNGEYNQVEVYISFIRKKLKSIGSEVKIKVHRNIGYSVGDCRD
ncbi:response regulator transcription factor [Clostridia bacterium]|nr:response regulator transcription factor [Clostridia bacterium]